MVRRGHNWPPSLSDDQEGFEPTEVIAMKASAVNVVFQNEAFASHEQVVFVRDRDSGLRAIIAVHDTTLGPGLGGTRMWPYETEAAALRDVLRLAQGMTYKSAMAGLSLGGAKGVILGDARTHKTLKLMLAYGQHVDRLGGYFVTGEDVGMTVADMDTVASVTPHVRGTSFGHVGDPSPHTALGVFKGIEAAAKHALGSDNIEGLSVCVQGLGNVGMALCELLCDTGVRLVVADLCDGLINEAKDRFGAKSIAADCAHAAEVDVYSPCALGATLNQRSIPDIRAKIVAGSANNQLETASDGDRLAAQNVLYAPDYVINAGGVISIAHDTEDFSSEAMVNDVMNIGQTLSAIFERSEAEGAATSAVADRMAEERLSRARCRAQG